VHCLWNSGRSVDTKMMTNYAPTMIFFPDKTIFDFVKDADDLYFNHST
jgi:hypothetical protein